ncbi:hypothetical protein JCM8547_002932 [Rhodosporidiobolus lusitaniae]
MTGTTQLELPDYFDLISKLHREGKAGADGNGVTPRDERSLALLETINRIESEVEQASTSSDAQQPPTWRYPNIRTALHLFGDDVRETFPEALRWKVRVNIPGEPGIVGQG